MQATVYIRVNQTNGKTYVGQSWDPQHRKRGYIREKTYFSRALQKHGWNAFDHYYFLVADQSEMDNLERVWIILLNTTNRSLGYNLNFGGRGGRHNEETKQKLREKALGRKMSEETKQKIARANTGKPGPNKGKPSPLKGRKGINTGPKSLETRRRMSLSLIGNKRSAGKVPWNKGLKYHNRRTLLKGVSNGSI